MKKFFTVVGLSFAALLVIGIITFGIIAYQGSGLDEESEKYVNEVTPIILSSLDRKTLFMYADQDLINSAKPEEFDKIFNMFKQPGSLQDYKGCNGQANINFNGTTKTITAYYEANASFDNGNAIIKVTTIKRDDQWKIIGFHINSPGFIQ